MNLIFEKSRTGRGCSILPKSDVPMYSLDDKITRKTELHLPQVAEVDISRHYTQLIKRTHGLNNGFYPLGSCTMKYNPKVNEEIASLPAFKKIHPLQPAHSVQGCMEVIANAEKYLCEISGMDSMTFQPAAGAHGELTGILIIKAYHEARGDFKRTKIIVPDAAHGTNPASATMGNFTTVSVPSNAEGCVDIEKLRELVGDDTAGLMLTNPNTVGIFDKNILEITKIIHDAGGLNYYDGANLNAVMGVVRPGDMGFDVVHMNLHKTFSTPHGGGGPGSGPVGCKKFLAPFMPVYHVVERDGSYDFDMPVQTIGSVKAFYGNFLVVVKALTYILNIGAEGILEASQNAVLNANYMRALLSKTYDIAFDGICMHEFVISLEGLKKNTGVSALDVAKMLLDRGIHPPTMYFPLIVHEALMFEPTETESKETLDEAVDLLLSIYEAAQNNEEQFHQAPLHTPVRRLDEVGAARNLVLRYQF